MDSPDQFQNLRRLLALKRHERPPPGYFNDFAPNVIVAIRTGNLAGEAAAERLSWEVPWLQRFLDAFSAKPALAGLLGAALCAAVVVGIVRAERLDATAIAGGDAAQPALALPSGANTLVFNQPLVQPDLAASTNALSQPNTAMPGGLFGLNPQPQRVSRPWDGN